MRDFSTAGRRSRTPPADGALLVAAAVALVASAYAASSARADLGRARAAVEDDRREAESLGSKAKALESRSAGGSESLAAQAALSAETPPPRVIADLTGLLPSGVRLDGLALAYGPRLDVEARVVARRAADYDVFLKRLADSTLFEGVLPGPENRDGELQASVQMTYRAGGAR